MYDPNDKKQVQKRERREKLAEASAADDVRAVMSTPEGRRFVHGLIGLCGVRGSAYRFGGIEQQRHQDYELGRQSVGLDLLDQIETHASVQTELMTAEAREAAKLMAETMAAEAIDAEQTAETEESTDG